MPPSKPARAESLFRTQTGADTILEAFQDLANAGNSEPSEWDVAVEAWKKDPKKFGMPGFKDSYPDHKRIYCDLGRLMRMGLVKRVRANHYRLTEAKSIRKASGPVSETAGVQTQNGTRMLVKRIVGDNCFLKWKSNPAYPERYELLSMFLKSEVKVPNYKNVSQNIVDKLSAIESFCPLEKGFDSQRSFSDAHDFLTCIYHRFFK